MVALTAACVPARPMDAWLGGQHGGGPVLRPLDTRGEGNAASSLLQHLPGVDGLGLALQLAAASLLISAAWLWRESRPKKQPPRGGCAKSLEGRRWRLEVARLSGRFCVTAWDQL